MKTLISMDTDRSIDHSSAMLCYFPKRRIQVRWISLCFTFYSNLFIWLKYHKNCKKRTAKFYMRVQYVVEETRWKINSLIGLVEWKIWPPSSFICEEKCWKYYIYTGITNASYCPALHTSSCLFNLALLTGLKPTEVLKIVAFRFTAQSGYQIS